MMITLIWATMHFTVSALVEHEQFWTQTFFDGKITGDTTCV